MTGKKNTNLNKTKKEDLNLEVKSTTEQLETPIVETKEVIEVVGGNTEVIINEPKPKAKTKAKAKAKSKIEDTNVKQEGGEKKLQKEPKVRKEPKVQKVLKEKKIKTETTEVNSEEELVNGRNLRSFKVKLPNSDIFVGRFTGLTPYQAANKALSKYFRLNKESNAEVIFSINETTRSSKKTVYNYVGKRFKLENPVTYEIKDAKDGTIRKIVKNYKNVLKKVKKVDN